MNRVVLLIAIAVLAVCAAGAQRTNRGLVKGEELVKLVNELPADFSAVERSHLSYRSIAEKALANLSAQSRQTEVVAKLGATSGSLKLAAESKRLQEMNSSFNLQYLTLQQKMQDESRRFTLLSNIMKTKHDTVKNSISNVR